MGIAEINHVIDTDADLMDVFLMAVGLENSYDGEQFEGNFYALGTASLAVVLR